MAVFVLNLTRRVRWRLAAAAALAAILIAVNLRAERPVIEVETDIERQARPVITGSVKPLYSVSTQSNKVALTFDISWGTVRPGPVLDVLQRYNQKATFFLSGPWSERHPDIVRRIKAEGHDIQSHGQKHVDFSGLSKQGVQENILAADKILQEAAGVKPTLIRPPNGDFNETSVIAAHEVGYRTVIWSVDSLDWKNPGVDVIIRRVVEKSHPGDIILMHASDSCKQTDTALPAVLEGLKAKGLVPVTLPELLQEARGENPRGIH